MSPKSNPIKLNKQHVRHVCTRQIFIFYILLITHQAVIKSFKIKLIPFRMKIKGHKDGCLIGDSIDVECVHPIAHHGKCKALKSTKYHK